MISFAIVLPDVIMLTNISVTCDWFLGMSRLNLTFLDVLALTETMPETQTARPPRAGWMVALVKPEVLGAWMLAGRAPPGEEGRREEEEVIVRMPWRREGGGGRGA